MPIPRMITVWAAAITSRTRTFEPTSAQRGSGVVLRRLRMPFSRCWTSGIAAKMPSCIRAMPRMLGTKNETLLRRLVWSDSGAIVSSGVAPDSCRFAAMTRPAAICWIVCEAVVRLGSVITVTPTGAPGWPA